MLFNSLEFILFLPAVFIAYWSFNKCKLRVQNIIILVSSYIFYGWWDVRFLSLIIVSTITDYLIGIKLNSTTSESKRKLLLILSIIVNIGILSFFKYFNFFLESLVVPLHHVGFNLNSTTLNIILPVGISFYTFQTLSYTIDVYRGKQKACTDLIAFASFISFFPQLVAGPIERATRLLPQFQKKRVFNYKQATDGFMLILWGFFKKIVIADNLAPSVNEIFANHQIYSGDILILGAVLFGFQIYCDFSGYSYIARGLAKWFGFELMVNFDFPYFSRNIGEFWRKWHISLSTWFRDYVYIPLGGSRVKTKKAIRNIFIIFLVSGFWHGANWTFIAWGAFHAFLFIPSFFLGTNKKYKDSIIGEKRIFPTINELLAVFYTFTAVTIAWIFFRSPTISDAFSYISGLFKWFDQSQFLNPYDNQPLTKEYIILVLFIVIEYLLNIGALNRYKRNPVYLYITSVILFVLIILNNPISQDLSFIYFQF